MKKVLLVHQDKIQHYRVPIYNYLYTYLSQHGFDLKVISEGIQEGGDCVGTFPILKMPLTFKGLAQRTRQEQPATVILFVNHGKPYFFPYLLFLRLTGVKAVTWTHGGDLQQRRPTISGILHFLEHALCQGIILYAEHLRPLLTPSHQKKAFVANNTLYLSRYDSHKTARPATLKRYSITTPKNIVCMGRIQKRKRIEDLIAAFHSINDQNIGLVFAGPDEEGLASNSAAGLKNIYITGPVYGSDAIDLLRSCDVYCIPGAIGLSIVDAQYCGLPVITEKVDHGPEIMFLKDGINGFMVPKGDIQSLAGKLRLLLTDDALHKRFSNAAKEEYATNGNIERLCEGFVECLRRLLSGKIVN